MWIALRGDTICSPSSWEREQNTEPNQQPQKEKELYIATKLQVINETLTAQKVYNHHIQQEMAKRCDEVAKPPPNPNANDTQTTADLSEAPLPTQRHNSKPSCNRSTIYYLPYFKQLNRSPYHWRKQPQKNILIYLTSLLSKHPLKRYTSYPPFIIGVVG